MTAIKLPLGSALGASQVQSFNKTQYEKIKEIIDKVNAVSSSSTNINSDTITEVTAAAGVTADGVLLKDNKVTASGGVSQGTANVTEFTVLTTLTSTQIAGTAAGDIGHANGAVLVAAPSSDYVLEFVSAVLIYDYATDAYTGGSDNMAIRVGSTAVSAAMTDTNCITAIGDKVFRLGAISTEVSLGVGSTINLAGTAFVNPGTAAGVLRVYTTYRIITTGL